jgi:hypothetical protein
MRSKTKFYSFRTNGLCYIRHVGVHAVGCVATFLIYANAHVQKAQVGLFTKADAKGCLAGLSPVYKNFNVHYGEELKIKTFYWTGKC